MVVSLYDLLALLQVYDFQSLVVPECRNVRIVISITPGDADL